MQGRERALAEYFDRWYAEMAVTPLRDRIMQRHLGLPPGLLSTSTLPWDAIPDVVEALRLRPGGALLDLACGRGGYGLEISARTCARLVGVDISAEAVRQAALSAERLGADAEFRVGELTDTGIEDGSVDAVVCVDAIQFAVRPASAYAELRRVLAPRGRVLLTCWEPLSPGDDRLPERLRRLNLGVGLTQAGFDDVAVVERPDWRALERMMWQEAASLDAGDDPALQSLHDEAVRSLATWGLVRRVVATATAPQAGAQRSGRRRGSVDVVGGARGG